VALKVEGDRVILPKNGDLVELLWSVVAFEDGAANKYTTLPKGKVGLVTQCVGCTFLVLIDGHEYAIGDDSLGVLQGASE
jgi:hypothetical protein